jgi:hypothetical protein
MPKSDDFDVIRRRNYVIVEVLFDDREIDSANSGQLHIGRKAPDPRLSSDEYEGSFDLAAYRVRRQRSIDAPPILRRPNLSGGDGRDLDRKR